MNKKLVLSFTLFFMVTHFFISLDGANRFNIESFRKIKPFSLPEQLVQAMDKVVDHNLVCQILEEGLERYGNDTKALRNFLLTKNSNGWTVVHNYVINKDLQNIMCIIEFIKAHMRPDYFFQILNEPNSLGRTALYFACSRYNNPGTEEGKQKDMDEASRREQKKLEDEFHIIKYLLSTAFAVFGSNKQQFLQFLNARQHDTGWTSLIMAGYTVKVDIAVVLLEYALKSFGTDSKEFKEFLNAKDNLNTTTYTYSPESIMQYLRPYGAEGEEFTGELY